MQTQNIVISTQNFPPSAGGIQNYMYELANALHDLGKTVRVICDGATESNQAEFDASLSFLIERFGGPKIFRRHLKAQRIQKLLKLHPESLLICDSWKSLELLKAQHLKKTTTICIAHGMEFPKQAKPKKSQRIATTLTKAQLILANSNFTAKRLTPYVNNPAAVQILHPGVRPPPTPTPGELNTVDSWIGQHNPVLLTVGRLEERKGQDKILAILPRLLKDFPKLIYMVAGSGPLGEKLQQQTEALGIENAVRFCGRVSDGERSALLERATLFAMPCRIEGASVEGFGIVYLEAAMFGLPSLAGRAGGAGDAVVDGETGQLCDGDSEEDVYQNIKNMLKTPKILQEMGREAKQRTFNEFKWHQAAQKLLDMSLKLRGQHLSSEPDD